MFLQDLAFCISPLIFIFICLFSSIANWKQFLLHITTRAEFHLLMWWHYWAPIIRFDISLFWHHSKLASSSFLKYQNHEPSNLSNLSLGKKRNKVESDEMKKTLLQNKFVLPLEVKRQIFDLKQWKFISGFTKKEKKKKKKTTFSSCSIKRNTLKK